MWKSGIFIDENLKFATISSFFLCYSNKSQQRIEYEKRKILRYFTFHF